MLSQATDTLAGAIASKKKKSMKNKALFSIMETRGVTVKTTRIRGTACAVEQWCEGNSEVVLVTDREVVVPKESVDQTTNYACRFPSKKHDHSFRICSVSTHQDFAFVHLEKNPVEYLTVVSVSKLREKGNKLWQSDCCSYYFGNSTSVQTVHWKYDKVANVHSISKIVPGTGRKELEIDTIALGSPVVSTQDYQEVIGVVKFSSDGSPYLKFFSESSLLDGGSGQRHGVKTRNSSDGIEKMDSPVYHDPSAPLVNATPVQQVSESKKQDSKNVVQSVTNQIQEMDIHRSSHSRTLSGKPVASDSGPYSVDGTRLFDDEKCIRYKKLKELVGFQGLLSSLKIDLDPKRELGGDYRSLAGVFEKDMRYIWYLDCASSPTEVLLQDRDPTGEELRRKLLNPHVGRSDVVEKLDDWFKSVGCNCSKCCSLR